MENTILAKDTVNTAPRSDKSKGNSQIIRKFNRSYTPLENSLELIIKSMNTLKETDVEASGSVIQRILSEAFSMERTFKNMIQKTPLTSDL
jgi:hypothetical protein